MAQRERQTRSPPANTTLGAGLRERARLRLKRFDSWDCAQFLRSVCIGEMFERGGKKIYILAHHYLEICSQACQQSSLPALLQHFAHGRCTTRTRPRFSPPFSADTDGDSPLLPLASLIPRPAAVPGGSGRRLVSTPRIDRTPESKPTSENFAWEIATLRKGGRKRLPHPPRCGETSPESARPAARPRTGGEGEGRCREAPPPPPRSLRRAPPRTPVPSRLEWGAPLGRCRSPRGPLSAPRRRRARRPPAPPGARSSRHFRPGGRMRRQGRRAPLAARYLAAGGTDPRAAGGKVAKRGAKEAAGAARLYPPPLVPPAAPRRRPPPPRACLGVAP